MINFDYWYIFPISVVVASLCNACGFSGSVLFQPFFNFVLGIPISESIATGIATETVGMTSGAISYWRMGNKINVKAVKKVLPYVYLGIIIGIFAFSLLPKVWLRLTVGIVIFFISSQQLYFSYFSKFSSQQKEKIKVLDNTKIKIKSFLSGVFSSSTGTGIAEIHQPIFERDVGLSTKRANASAILIEALGNWLITLLNLSFNNINYEILIFSASGVFIGGQIGPILSKYVSDIMLKTIFSVSVGLIGLIYIQTSLDGILS